MSYSAYSDERPKWVAQVPEHWDCNWLKWSVDLCANRPTVKEQETLPYIANEHIASWTGKLLIKEPKPVEAGSRAFQQNDVLFNKLRPYLAKVHHATFDGVSSGELLCLRPKHAVESRFLFYVLLSKGFIDTVNAKTFGAKMPRADWGIVGHHPLPLPIRATQLRIVRFLDEKTGRIDRLIEKKRELLELLTEKRQALITRAVTKGIDPNASMKPRGESNTEIIDGAGDIIEHALQSGWSSRRLKHLATYNDEVLAESTGDEREIDYIEISGVSLPYGIKGTEKMTFGQAPSRARRKVRSGDILISTVRTYLRAIATVDKASPDLIASTGFCVVRPNDGVDNGFLGWAVKSEPFIAKVVARSVGVSYPAINARDLVNIDIPLPSFNTQRRIARFLDERTARLDELHHLIVKSINTLAEYRSALITVAVTGQLPELQ